MKNDILDLIDFKKVDLLLEGFNKTTGFVTAILDLNGRVLSKSGWREMCTNFHRVNPETSKKCTISDTLLAGKMAKGEKIHFYKCLNGLVDVALPIVIDGEHIANLFSGQFFFEEPNRKFFKKQAQKYKFNEEEYIEALEKVPVVSKEKVKTAMDFLLNMTQLISEMTFQKLEQIELNREIRESEEKFKSVFETANVGKSITLPTGEIDVNEALCKILGYTHDELKNKKWQEITPEEEIPTIEKTLNSLLKGEKDSARFEKRYICKNGTNIWADVSVSIQQDNKGKPLYFITTIIDITERKRLEEERKKFTMLAESSSEFIGMCDLDFNPFYVNPEGMRLVGLSDMKSACNVSVKDYFFPEDQQFIINEFFPKVLHDGKGEIEIRLRHFKTGKAIWMFYYLFSLRDSGGNIIGWATVSHDITERKKADEALKKSEHNFHTLAESMPQIVWITRADGWNIYFNQQWVDYTGLTLEESYGHDWNKPFHRDDKQLAWDAWQNAVNTNGIYSIEARLRRFDGEYRWWLVRGVPLIDENGAIQKWFGTCTDINAIKQAEEQNKKQLIELKRYNATMVDREIKMIQLKQEINESCRQLNLPEKYSIPTKKL